MRSTAAQLTRRGQLATPHDDKEAFKDRVMTPGRPARP
jgi:hypothetical protein